MYGAYAASSKYFGKLPKDLSLSEALYLAAIIRAPDSLLRHPDRLLKVRAEVLDRMLHDEFITQEEKDHAEKGADG
jgi:membrane peptidoglycan carboxypeptidase